ncbi:MAG TPA: hypothetical protein VFD36_23035, partial [Kofleriaceae bacterium]|nr:hypothetical protein [Kofleriaceae bacterium]
MTDDLEARRRMTPAARASQVLTEERRRATQAELEAAARKYSTAAGEAGNRAGLASPLTAAELEAGGGYGVGITDVDCTPRPRYGESQEKFLARMASYGANVEELKREIRMRNRAAALRQVELPTGAIAYWTVCACEWCGLRVDDPEVARREYDAHVCVAENVGQDAVDRAQAHAGKATLPPKRTQRVLQPAIVEKPAPDMSHLANYDLAARPGDLTRQRAEVDDT